MGYAQSGVLSILARRPCLELRRDPGRGAGIVNVVQAGLGSWGRSWIELFSDDSGVELAADNVKSLAVMLGCVGSIERGEPVDVAALLAARGAKL